MAVEPAEGDIANFGAITDLQRGEAIRWLKAYGNDVNSAMNAFYDNAGVLKTLAASTAVKDAWDENAFHSDRTEYGPHNQAQQSFSVHPQDTLNPGVFDGGMSRPPSPVSNRGNDRLGDDGIDPNQPRSLAQEEDFQLEQAIAISKGEALPSQEVGVTDASRPYFGPPTRDYYDNREWMMTTTRHNAQEILINPDPPDRKREPGSPAFLKPSPAKSYLPSLITILHAIPMAREALLARNHTLPEYGSSNEWWDGMPIHTPKIIDLEHPDAENDWEDIIFESQRLMAFLDQSDRAYGSTDVLANMKGVRSREDVEGGFLETWQEACSQASLDEELGSVFVSRARSTDPQDLNVLKEDPFFCLDLRIYDGLANTGQTLYEAFDDALWAGFNPGDSEEIYLNTIGEVFAIRVFRMDEAESGLGIRIPSVWYADRYLKDSVKATKEMRLEKEAVKKDVQRIEYLRSRITKFRLGGGEVEGVNLIDIAKSYFQRSGTKANITNGAQGEDGDILMAHETDQDVYSKIAGELEAVAERVSQKVKALEVSKEQAMEKLRELSKLYTQPASEPGQPPHHRYTLRGVSANYRITYVLEKTKAEDPDDMLSSEALDWQWWKISYAESGAKPISYEILSQKVREIEVLKAAKNEYRTALLVYASDKAVAYETGDLLPQLRNFVRADNLAFAAELEKFPTPNGTTPTKRKADANYDSNNNNDIEALNWGGYRSPTPTKATKPFPSSKIENVEESSPPPYSASKPPAILPRSSPSRASSSKNQPRNIPSYNQPVPTSLIARGPTIDSSEMALNDIDLLGDEIGGRQEMQQRQSGSSLLPSNTSGSGRYTLRSYVPEIIMEDGEDEGKEKAD